MLPEGHLEPRLGFLVCFVQLKYSTSWPISSHHFKGVFCLSDKKARLLLKETHIFLLDCPKRSQRRLGFLGKGSLHHLLRGALEGSTCRAGQCRGRSVSAARLIQSGHRGAHSPGLLRPLRPAPSAPGARRGRAALGVGAGPRAWGAERRAGDGLVRPASPPCSQGSSLAGFLPTSV